MVVLVVMVMVSVVAVADAIVAIEIMVIVTAAAAVIVIGIIVLVIGIRPRSSPFTPSSSPIIQPIIQSNMVKTEYLLLIVPFLPPNFNLEPKLGIGNELEVGMEIVRMRAEDCAG